MIKHTKSQAFRIVKKHLENKKYIKKSRKFILKKSIRKNSRKSSKKSSKKSIRKSNVNKKEKEFTYYIGDFGNSEQFIVIKFTQKFLYMNYYKNNEYNFNYKDDTFTTGKSFKTLKYEYTSLYMSENHKDGKEIFYPNLIKFNDHDKYILVHLKDNHYLSLGFMQYDLYTPDNDKIIIANNGDTHRSGNQGAYLIGEKYTYYIDDGAIEGTNYYLSNEIIKNIYGIIPNYNSSFAYDLTYNIYFDKELNKFYVNVLDKKEKHEKKILGIKYTKWKDVYKKVYNVCGKVESTII